MERKAWAFQSSESLSIVLNKVEDHVVGDIALSMGQHFIAYLSPQVPHRHGTSLRRAPVASTCRAFPSCSLSSVLCK